MPDLQAQMQRLLEAAVTDGREGGLQLTVYHRGRMVVDAWAGIAAPGRPVEGDTLFPVFSVTKGIAATLAHLLVERGQVEYDTPIAAVWPEFAAHGKSGITLRHALSHTAGLPYMPLGVGYRELGDWDAMCRAMAAAAPVSPPGEQQVYHAVTFSWLVGEVLQRVSGRSFEQLLEEEIRRPLDIRDLYVGLPEENDHRVAVLDEIFEPGKEPSTQTAAQQSVPGWMMPLHTMMNRPDGRRACIPASSGIMSARALARHYAALLPCGVDGVELLPTSRIALACERQRPRVPSPDDGKPKGLGYFLGGGEGNFGIGPRSFGHGGYGGSIGFADPDRQLAVGLTKNLFSPRAAHGETLDTLRRAFP